MKKNGKMTYNHNDAGSLFSDVGRRIARIDYDQRNNPVRIQFTDGSVTEYVYSATGEKLRVIHQTAVPNISVPVGFIRPLSPSEILSADSTDYLLGGALTLRNGRIDKYLFEEGYCQASMYSSRPSQDDFTFYYYDRDHLGNIRQVIMAGGFNNGTPAQKTDYYPFGARLCDGTADNGLQPYKYNGKEFDGMHGLNTYDYGARQYNPVTARWDRTDPLSEKYYAISPYAYCAGNPVNAIDIHGDSITFVGNSDDKNYSISVLNNSLGFDYVQMDGNGILSENMRSSLVSYVMMNKCQEQLFKMLRKCINAPGGMTTIGLVNNSEDVIIGSAALKQIDVGDIQAISNHTQDKLPFNPTGALSHEIFEQYLIQQKGVDVDTAHRQASGAESIIVGSHIPPNRMIEGNTLNINIFDLRNQERMTYSIKVQLNNNNITNIVHKSF